MTVGGSCSNFSVKFRLYPVRWSCHTPGLSRIGSTSVLNRNPQEEVDNGWLWFVRHKDLSQGAQQLSSVRSEIVLAKVSFSRGENDEFLPTINDLVHGRSGRVSAWVCPKCPESSSAAGLYR